MIGRLFYIKCASGSRYSPSMQETSGASSAKSAQDFARLMAALTAAKPNKLPDWNEDEPVQDVATLSYERALRTHARYKSGVEIDPPHLKDSREMRPGRAAQRGMRTHLRGEAQSAPGSGDIQTFSVERKCASVTIRMSRAECEQLHARAAEAGMTISAYLRSCTFEAETLRAQVKEALAELRNAPAAESKPETSALDRTERAEDGKPQANTRLRWLRNLIPEMHPTRRLVRA